MCMNPMFRDQTFQKPGPPQQEVSRLWWIVPLLIVIVGVAAYIIS